MSFSYISEKYIKQLALYTDQFTDNGNDTFNCRCKYCGDSATCAYKARGYFYKTKSNNWRYKCHNCAINKSISDYLKDIEPSLHKEYVMEIFKEKGGNGNSYKKEIKEETPHVLQCNERERTFKESIYTSTINNIMTHVINISDLNTNHIAYQYLTKRCIPINRMKELYYIESLKDVVACIPQYKDKNVPDMNGIMIPYYEDNILSGFQIRNLDNNSKMRYLTYDIFDTDHIYNINNIKKDSPIYVFEGAFDSMFCTNGVSASGASIIQKLNRIKSINENVVVVFDNDYKTNNEILKLVHEVIDFGYSVVIYDKKMDHIKDINKYVTMMNKSVKDIDQYLKSNTYKGLQARLQLSNSIDKKKTKIDVSFGKNKSIFCI